MSLHFICCWPGAFWVKGSSRRCSLWSNRRPQGVCSRVHSTKTRQSRKLSPKLFPRRRSGCFSSTTSISSLRLPRDVTPAIIHARHGLSGQIRSREPAPRQPIVQYQYCDGWGAARPHISGARPDNWKGGDVAGLTPESLQGIPFKTKANLTWQSKAIPGQE